MWEFMGRVRDGLPELEVHAHAWLPGPRSPAVIYTHPLTIQILDEDDGQLQDTDALLTRARCLGWVTTDDYAGWAVPCPGWSTTLIGDHLLVRSPDGAAWYDGTLPTSECWRRAARETGRLYHFTAEHQDLGAVGRAIAAGQALAIATSLD
ncbi:hypothetical protein [Streptomyces sp. 7N604]|uniref:hypothetical protein n=1 Tax=Streptomyces sp. 7N604 TaxID=3457415 RepID=UPI003FD5129E